MSKFEEKISKMEFNMSKFEEKISKMEFKLSHLQFFYGYYNSKVVNLRKKLEIYKEVAQMSHKEIGEQLTYAAGEVAKLKSGYYGHYTSVDKEKKLLNVLRERIKSDKKEREHGSVCDLIEIGHAADDKTGGFEC